MNLVWSSAVVCAGLLLGTFGMASVAQAAPRKVLVVTTTTGFRHSSIPTAEKVIGELAQKSGLFTVDYARVEPSDPQYCGADGKRDNAKVEAAIKAVLAEKMSPQALKQYDAIIFANTTGDLPVPDKEAFLNWIKSGKGFVGMHSATDTFHGFAGYIDMIGGEFKTHAAQLEVHPINQDTQCPACAHLGKNWSIYDEIYQMKNFDPAKVHGLLTLDQKPDVKDRVPGNYPIAWCKEYGMPSMVHASKGAALLLQKDWVHRPGRVFYTSLGHREDVWDPTWTKDRKNSKEVAEAYQTHILNGIKWALGLENWNAKPQKNIE